jgi:hypothetical protein
MLCGWTAEVQLVANPQVPVLFAVANKPSEQRDDKYWYLIIGGRDDRFVPADVAFRSLWKRRMPRFTSSIDAAIEHIGNTRKILRMSDYWIKSVLILITGADGRRQRTDDANDAARITRAASSWKRRTRKRASICRREARQHDSLCADVRVFTCV